MPFPLTDLRRRYGRSGVAGGPPDVRPYLLAGKELPAQRERLQEVVAWYQSQVGRRQAEVDFDDLARVAGDYRLARCLGACLQTSFKFAPRPFDEALGALGPRRRTPETGPTGPSELRLRLFERVALEGGFVPPEGRDEALAAVATDLGLTGAELDDLLWLDAERNQRLEAIAPPPAPEALAAAYNRRALATLLVRTLSADLVLPDPDGAAVRRLYFLVKRHGLLCDLELVVPALGPAGGVHVHLYGPLEVFGPRTRHGDRFAAVLLGLLFRFPDLEGSARVLLNEREYRFVLGPDVAEALGDRDPLEAAPEEAEGDQEAPPAPETPATAIVARPQVIGAFDSEVEARLFATLQGMARRGDASGWTAEREAEPLIWGSTVMVPDFLLTCPAARGRPAQRVFVEVVGFWTPAYRERKRDKLRQLGEHVPLVLVVQEALAGHFDDLPFPILTYKHRVPATDLIRLLNRHFVRPGEDASAVREDAEALLEALDPGLGFVGADELRRALELPTAGALAEAMREATAGWRWVPGAGVAHEAWLEALGARCVAALAGQGGEGELEALRETVRGSGLAGAGGAAEHLEALLGVLGYEVVWRTLFEATVRITSASP
jgi:predicted nuclease of restriction endonuclease-like RecB superfamily